MVVVVAAATRVRALYGAAITLITIDRNHLPYKTERSVTPIYALVEKVVLLPPCYFGKYTYNNM